MKVRVGSSWVDGVARVRQGGLWTPAIIRKRVSGAWVPPLGVSDPLADQIAAMFGANEDGALWDAFTTSSLWADTAGTAPATASGAVARVDDLSGAGRHATQASSAARPLRTDEGSGVVGLLFDGIDDHLDFPDWHPTADYFAAYQVKMDADTGMSVLANNGNTGTRIYVTTTTIGLRHNGIGDQASISPGTATVGAAFVDRINYESGDVTVWRDSSHGPFTIQAVGRAFNRIGQNRLTDSLWFDGVIYNIMIRDAAASSTLRDDYTDFLTGRMA